MMTLELFLVTMNNLPTIGKNIYLNLVEILSYLIENQS